MAEMTRKEAWERIDIIIAKHEGADACVTITDLKDYDALRTAREVLEQQPCGDAISRELAIKGLTGFYEPLKDEDIITVLKGLPSVTPTQKTKAEIIDDLIKEIEDAEKKFDDKGAHHVSTGFYYARKELEKMKGAE